jgi:alcohol dehydrogenase
MAQQTKSPHPALVRRGDGLSADGEFNLPTRVLYGRGVSADLGKHATARGATRVLVVVDPGVLAAGLVDPVLKDLRSSGLHVVVFSDVEQNPRDLDCLTGAATAHEAQIDLVVGLGGGSAIDTAKCVALLVTNGGAPRDWEDFGALHHEPLPLIAVPTTAGTGSEVSPSAVITDTVRKKKMNLFDVRNLPVLALVDPDLTFSCPQWVTASSGMDALSHAVDSLQCRLATPASDALALEGARLVASHIRRAYSTPSDVEARCGMAQGSLVAGMAVGLTDVSGTHCLAEALGGLYGRPHGYCCAACMPPIMEYNLPVSTAKYARLAHAFGLERDGRSDEDLAQQAIGFVRELNRDLDVPAMSSFVRADDLELLGHKADQNTSNPSNPRAADAAAYQAMFAREIERSSNRSPDADVRVREDQG